MSKSPLFFILIGIGLMVGALVATYFVWQTVQTELQTPTAEGPASERAPITPSPAPVELLEPEPAPAAVASEAAAPAPADVPVETSETESPATPAPAPSEPAPAPDTPQTNGIPLSSLPLTDGQRSAAATFGIDVDTFVITPAMQTCAAGTLGAARYDAIIAGAAPSFTEGLSLLGCLRA